jgi:hypothetical protein
MTLTYTGNLGSGVSLWDGLVLAPNVPVPITTTYQTTAGGDLVSSRGLEFSEA